MTKRIQNWKKTPSGNIEMLIKEIITEKDATYRKMTDENENAGRMKIESGKKDYVINAGDCIGQKDENEIISYEIQPSKDEKEVASRD